MLCRGVHNRLHLRDLRECCACKALTISVSMLSYLYKLQVWLFVDVRVLSWRAVASSSVDVIIVYFNWLSIFYFLWRHDWVQGGWCSLLNSFATVVSFSISGSLVELEWRVERVVILPTLFRFHVTMSLDGGRLVILVTSRWAAWGSRWSLSWLRAMMARFNSFFF